MGAPGRSPERSQAVPFVAEETSQEKLLAHSRILHVEKRIGIICPPILAVETHRVSHRKITPQPPGEEFFQTARNICSSPANIPYQEAAN